MLLNKDIELLKEENVNLGKAVNSLKSNLPLSHGATYNVHESNRSTDSRRWESVPPRKSNRPPLLSTTKFLPLRTINRVSPLLDQSTDVDDVSENGPSVRNSSCNEELMLDTSLSKPRPTENRKYRLSLRKKPLKVHLYADSQGRSVCLKVSNRPSSTSSIHISSRVLSLRRLQKAPHQVTTRMQLSYWLELMTLQKMKPRVFDHL